MASLTRATPRSLFVFSLFYGGMVCIAGVLGNKLIALGPLSRVGPLIGLPPLGIEAGIFAFLLLVVTSSSTAEIHDRKTANALVGFGFIPLLMSMALLMLVDWLPASQDMQSRPEAIAATVVELLTSERSGEVILHRSEGPPERFAFARLPEHDDVGYTG